MNILSNMIYIHLKRQIQSESHIAIPQHHTPKYCNLTFNYGYIIIVARRDKTAQMSEIYKLS